MKLTTSSDADPNYLAVVVKVPIIQVHPKADKLSLVEVFGNTIIIQKDGYIENELVVYFPVESCLNPNFLSWANLYDKSELNADEKTKGFFSSKGNRVKAVSLRSIPSQGFLFKVSKLAEYYNTSVDDFKLGTSFDTVGDDRLVTKYVRNSPVQAQNVAKSKVPEKVKKFLGVLPKPVRTVIYPFVTKFYGVQPKDDGIKSQIVAGQFKFHYKTEQLGRNIFILKPDDEITITSKVHGTSAAFSNLLCKRKLTWFEKMKLKLGKFVPEREYKFIYNSRNTLKNRKDGLYTSDVWGYHAKELDGKIPEGISLYGEIVGWVNHDKMVQKNYDYGIKRGESEFWVYRITHTDEFGQSMEYDWEKIEKFCVHHGLKTVPVYKYWEKAKHIYDIPEDENFGVNFLHKLKTQYLDKKCELCTTGVINEGIVIKFNNKENCPVFKFKSPMFVEGESKARDAGDEDLEEEN